ncbi:Iq and aaa domain containing protein 1 [Plakobranchus ocellatus]|uniref:Iq and aaa domain containing protein 1 n=1 Tax=Plakobranchus ocellatus TaxID=259542 RepID=A0AAV3Y848_9GAST|nr:Iq and aaa domain containing protein 1 [Plakobranchus ocellatus]
MEPTIILVDECHLLFATKKAPKRPDVELDKPARWARMLTRLLKKLKKGDRILLVGVTNQPFFAKTKPMCKLFPNTLLAPFPEYGSRLVLWKNYLERIPAKKLQDVNISVMAKLSEGCTGKHIKAAVENTCTQARMGRKRRLRNSEFISALTPEFPDEDAPKQADWLAWYLTMPILQTRGELLRAILEEEEEAAATAAKAAKRK